jgi:hypothetical protein
MFAVAHAKVLTATARRRGAPSRGLTSLDEIERNWRAADALAKGIVETGLALQC